MEHRSLKTHWLYRTALVALFLGPFVVAIGYECFLRATNTPAENLVRLGYIPSGDVRWVDPDVLPAIVRATSSPDVRLRRSAYQCLLYLLDDTATVFFGEKKLRVDGDVATILLARGLRDDDPRVRRKVANGIDCTWLLSMKYDLYSAMTDTDPEVRRLAIYDLASLGKEARFALPRIRQAMNDPEAVVRDEARDAVNRISEEEAASDPDDGLAGQEW